MVEMFSIPLPIPTQRQLFFRKKLLHSSQMLRAVSLGQDRYRRHYWVLPCLAGIFVEGSEGSTVTEDEIKQETESLMEAVTSTPSSTRVSVKRELTGSITSTSPRSRGRPRKPKPGCLQPQHLKSTIREHDPGPQPQPQPQAPTQPHLQSSSGFLEPEGSPFSLGQSQHDLSQSAFLSWLSQTHSHNSLLSSSVLTPDSSPGKLDSAPSQSLEEPEPDEAQSCPGPQGPWFNFSAQIPCDAAPTPPPAVSEDQPTPSLQLPAASKPVRSQISLHLMVP